ncbi:hypothetical protein FDF96_04905 [Clostridium botulinum]|uniref:hypothetical protein n=1 Tax=Clostridium botulinum TaxID=1491 RepID=UPI00144E36BC|nr:hypothetical protein [Clostridium botulinum]MCD3245280.1 hypothetical protein [Clostridium botulinum C]MCD3261659.1 hypothetical protein [Clostridium botulinum C]NFV19216.1 hypothetical protein [Clostridium botulinum]
MLNIILNESKVIEEALKGNIQNNKITPILQLLIKHYYLNGMTDKLQLKEQILNYLKNNYEGYKRAKWESTIEKMVKRFLKLAKNPKVEIKITDIDKIQITKNELKTIEQLNNKQLEKIAFVLLVYGKISNIIIKENDGWINQSCTIICKEAKVGLQGIEKTRIFHELYKKKYIEQSKHNAKTNMRVCYIDKEYINEDVELTINDFNGVVHQYLIWKGESWIKCASCQKWARQKSNKTKYCPKCAREIEKEKHKERNKRWYKNKNSDGLENHLKPLV